MRLPRHRSRAPALPEAANQSGKQTLRDMAMDIGQAALDPVVVEGKSLVIHAQELEQGGVNIVELKRFVDRAETDVVAGAVGHARLHSGAGHPDGEGVGMVVAARAFKPCVTGVRPNSVVQRTSVSSSMPRDFKSLSKPATGLSMTAA